jgi:hypothetical protein
MSFDEAVQKALKTWYPKDHELHMNPHHPLGKLLGEWGELLDDYMKFLYKPGYVFEPEDELGDIWYYVRVLCYQKGYKPDGMVFFRSNDTDQLITGAMGHLVIAFRDSDNYSNVILNTSFTALFAIARHYNLTLDDLTASNWNKLKPGSERGEQWAKARAAKSEPMPRKGQADIWPLVVDDIKSLEHYQSKMLSLVINDMESRVEVGQNKYGVVLQSHNGRYAIMDAYQEAIDLAMYLRQSIAEGSGLYSVYSTTLELIISLKQQMI